MCSHEYDKDIEKETWYELFDYCICPVCGFYMSNFVTLKQKKVEVALSVVVTVDKESSGDRGIIPESLKAAHKYI